MEGEYQACITALEETIEKTLASIKNFKSSDTDDSAEKSIAETIAHDEAVRVQEELEKDNELESLRQQVQQLKMEVQQKS